MDLFMSLLALTQLTNPYFRRSWSLSYQVALIDLL